MGRSCIVLLGVLVACSAPTSRAPRPKKPPKIVVEASADPDHPLVLSLTPGKWPVRTASVTANVHAPSAGTYWFEVLAPVPPNTRSSILFSTLGVIAPVELSVIDDAGRATHDAHRLKRGYDVFLEVPRSDHIPSRWRLRLVVLGHETFELISNQDLEPMPEPVVEYPECDYHAIDPSNPRCDGVPPACDLNHPDFKNPRCCDMRTCALHKLGCRANLLRTVDISLGDFEIDLGAEHELMRFALGYVVERERDGKRTWNARPTVMVVRVLERTAYVSVTDRGTLSPQEIIANGKVVLTPSEACLPH